jgi:cytoskeletal protein RodZ
MSRQLVRKENDMRARLTKLMAGLTVVAALAFGGATLAGAATNSPPAPPPAADTIQSGDQTAPDVGGAAAESSSESPSAPESASSESASESATASDGPGGHADEPGNATADYQFEGVQ